LYCIVLYCIVLYCIILYYIILYYIILYYIILYYIILYYIIFIINKGSPLHVRYIMVELLEFEKLNSLQPQSKTKKFVIQFYPLFFLANDFLRSNLKSSYHLFSQMVV